MAAATRSSPMGSRRRYSSEYISALGCTRSTRMRDSIPCLRGSHAGCADPERARREMFPLLEHEAVGCQPAVAVEMRPCPQVDLEEPEHALAVALDQLAPGRLEVARPR